MKQSKEIIQFYREIDQWIKAACPKHDVFHKSIGLCELCYINRGWRMSRNKREGKYSGKLSAMSKCQYSLKTGHIRTNNYFYEVSSFCAMAAQETKLLRRGKL